MCYRPPTGQTARGTLRESTPNERIAFGWGYDATDTSTVTIQRTPTAAGTTVTLTHAGLTGTQRSEHAQGWTHYLGQLSGGAANMGFVAARPLARPPNIARLGTKRISPPAPVNSGPAGRMTLPSAIPRASPRGAHITNTQKFVPGFALELAGTPEQCHGYYRFPWLIRLPDGSVMGRGTNFRQLAGMGRFLSAIGFWDKL